MNTNPNRLREIEPTPEQKARYFSQAGFKVWAILPPTLSGLFVVVYQGPHVLAFFGPFVGMCALEALIFRIFRTLHALGADSYKIARKE